MGICLTGSIWCREAAASRWWSQDPFRRLATRPTPSGRATLSINMREMDLVLKPGVDPGYSRGAKPDTDLPYQLNRKQSSAFTSSQSQGEPLSKGWRRHNIRNKTSSLKNVQYSMPLGKGQKLFYPFHNASTAWRTDSSEAEQQGSDIITTTIQILLDGTKNLVSTSQMHLIGISGSFPPIHSVISHTFNFCLHKRDFHNSVGWSWWINLHNLAFE